MASSGFGAFLWLQILAGLISAVIGFLLGPIILLGETNIFFSIAVALVIWLIANFLIFTFLFKGKSFR
jgi:hypothetical protein